MESRGHCVVLMVSCCLWMVVQCSHTNLFMRQSNSDNIESSRRVKRSGRMSWASDMVFPEEEKPIAKSLEVNGSITDRFAETCVVAVMENPSYEDDREATFEVQIPDASFISNFTMLIEEELFIAEIKGKEEAEIEYKEAKDQDQTAGKVTSRPRDIQTAARGMQIFAVSVNVAPNSSVEFKLCYQEVLVRKLGKYPYIISIRPGQLVEQLSVNVNFTESTGITELSSTGPDEGTSDLVNIQISPDQTSAIVTYNIGIADQMAMHPEEGISGDLVLRYGINDADNTGIGTISSDGGYLVHSYPSKKLAPLPKNIVFVIDISGSMQGRKIEQTLEAMLVILDQLREDDMFMLILFSSQNKYWPNEYDKHRYEGEMVGVVSVEQPTTTEGPWWSGTTTGWLRPQPRPRPYPVPSRVPPPSMPNPVPAPSQPFPAPPPSLPALQPHPVPAPSQPLSNRAPAPAPAGAPSPVPAPAPAPGSHTRTVRSAVPQPGIPSFPGSSPGGPVGPYPPPRPPMPNPMPSHSARPVEQFPVRTGMVRATQFNIEQAKNYVKEALRATGSTNINDALLAAIRILKAQALQKGLMIVFLTDGEPTVGVTNPELITDNVVQETNGQPISIFSLGFGFNLDFDLLEMLSINTDGRVKRIYEDADAALQLTLFYEEIHRATMYDIEFELDENVVIRDSITQSTFPQLFDGTEILIAAKLKPDVVLRGERSSEPDQDVMFCGVGMRGWNGEPIDYYTTVQIKKPINVVPAENDIDCIDAAVPRYEPQNQTDVTHRSYHERLWANMKIKHLLKLSKVKRLSEEKKEKAKLSATCLALKYHLVTPVTSLLIVQGAPDLPPGNMGERGRAGGMPAPQGIPGPPPAYGFPGPSRSAGPRGPVSRMAGGPMGPMGYPGQQGFPINNLMQGPPAPMPTRTSYYTSTTTRTTSTTTTTIPPTTISTSTTTTTTTVPPTTTTQTTTTTTTNATTTTEAPCEDKNKECRFAVKYHMCESLKTYCRKSCGNCTQINTNMQSSAHHSSKRSVIDSVIDEEISAAITHTPSFYVFTILTFVLLLL